VSRTAPVAERRWGTRAVASLDRLMQMSGGGVYAEPLQVGEEIVITASRIDARGDTPGRRVGVIHAARDGVRFRPAFDARQLAMTAALAAIVVWRFSRL
jgi:hypothetical protein